ncbi:glycosyltransferase, partial [Oleiphilus sp. HI0125]
GTSRDIIAPELIPYALYKAQNESSFIAALQKIYTLSTDKRSLVGDNAHAFVQTHFEKSQTTQKTLQLYKELWQKSAMVSKL